MRRHDEDYYPRGHAPARRLADPVRDDRHRIERGDARDRIRLIDESHTERLIRSDRDRDRVRVDRGDRPDRGDRMDFIDDARIAAPRGDPRANTAVRREDRQRDATLTVYEDKRTGLYRDAKTHEFVDVPGRPITQSREDDYDDDMVMEHDEPPRRRLPERDPVYYDRKSRGPKVDDYDDYDHETSGSGYGMIKTFVDGAGIDHQVIQTDICRYLGNDAHVWRATHKGREGYWVRAYRALTTAQLEDLRMDSAKQIKKRLERPSGIDRAPAIERATGPYPDIRGRDDRDAMDVDMDHDPVAARDRYRGELEPRLAERVDRHRIAPPPVTSGYVEPPHPSYTLGPGQGSYGAAQRPRTTGNYSPQGTRPSHATYSSGSFDNRAPVSVAPVATSAPPFRDARASQYPPIEQGTSGGFAPAPSRSSGRHGR